MTTATAKRRRGTQIQGGLPFGRRTPKGRVRWYVLRVPEGREDSVCTELRRCMPGEVLDDAFALRKEHWMKRSGKWWLEPKRMYRGYVFAVSRDAAGLAKALQSTSISAGMVGARGRSWAPLADEAAEWFASSMDEHHVLRNSVAVIVDGELHVQKGPLVGQESRVSDVDCHRRRCRVAICDADGGFTESMPIDVPFKS